MSLFTKKKNVQISSNNKSSSFMLCVLMICVELGNKHTIMGIKISYLGCLFFAISLIIDALKNRLVLFSSNRDICNFQFFLLAWLFYGIIQTIVNSLFDQIALEGLILLILNILLAFFLLVNSNSRKHITRYINVISIMLIICIIISFWEIKTGNHIIEITYYEKYRNLVFATFYNQNDYCTFLCLGIILQILGVKLANNKKQKVFYITIIILSGYMAYYTQSRASYICLLIFAVLWFVYSVGEKILFRNAGLITYVIVSSAVIMVFLCGGVTVLIYLIDPERLMIYSRHIAVISNNFLFGYGPMMLAKLTGIAPHNLYIEFIGDFGIVFFILFFYFTLVKFLRYSTNGRPSRALLCAFALMIPILGCSSSNIQRIRIFWMAIALCYSFLFNKTTDDFTHNVCQKISKNLK